MRSDVSNARATRARSGWVRDSRQDQLRDRHRGLLAAPATEPELDAISNATAILRYRAEHGPPTVPPRVAARNSPDPDNDPAAEDHEDPHYITALILGGAVIVIPTIYYWATKPRSRWIGRSNGTRRAGSGRSSRSVNPVPG